ncbi:MAG TPA: glycosyltransferase family 2 protein [Methylophilus sp.]|nr:glycosyltransferase family 2 protein [Methylophilus sp.]HQQ33790.1 glycosyltransferase family 2 protein [Methylophilus sp.]
MYQPEQIGVVAIGRNEGERLITCLRSALDCCPNVVYVDSGSTDNSVAAAKRLGVDVVNLDMSKPFTAARARNAGAHALMELHDLQFIQFIDGDCEFFAHWLEQAEEYLQQQLSTAVVAGRLRERHPEASIYNQMCDIEWDTPAGDTKACGGIMMIRTEAFRQVQGFNESLIAGEEPEMCVRLRQKGWKIHRLANDMALHDADMHAFSQWWKRTQRAGYAYAEGASLHGAAPEKHWVKERNRAWIWAVAIPLLCLALLCYKPLLGMAALAIYPLQIFRTARHFSGLGKFKWTQASFLMLGKFAEITGQFKFYRNRLLSRRSQLIEHKR